MFFLCLAEEFAFENADQMGALVFVQDDEHIGAQPQDGDDAAGQEEGRPGVGGKDRTDQQADDNDDGGAQDGKTDLGVETIPRISQKLRGHGKRKEQIFEDGNNTADASYSI